MQVSSVLTAASVVLFTCAPAGQPQPKPRVGDNLPATACSYEDTGFNIIIGEASLARGPKTGRFSICKWGGGMTGTRSVVLQQLGDAGSVIVALEAPRRTGTFKCAETFPQNEQLSLSYGEGSFGVAANGAGGPNGIPSDGTCIVTVTEVTDDKWVGTFSGHLLNLSSQSADIDGTATLQFTARADR